MLGQYTHRTTDISMSHENGNKKTFLSLMLLLISALTETRMVFLASSSRSINICRVTEGMNE